MNPETGKFVYRIIPIENLSDDLKHGMFSKKSAPNNPGRIVIGNKEIINERDNRSVKCYPGTVVNDFVPFYFSVRTPMLFNIVTGMGVPERKQEDIVYLCILLNNVMCEGYQWCFTDGNAAKTITSFFNKIADLKKIDWRSIESTDFRNENADGDVDRIRKKHAEFLVKDFVPGNLIEEIVVFNEKTKISVEKIVKNLNLKKEIKVIVNTEYYF
jgi:hypothetical protein